VTVQVGEVHAATADVTWPGQLIEAELAAMLGRRLAELDFLGADVAPFDDVLGRLVRGPGKRLRPAFVYWGYRAAGGAPAGPDADAALRVGCAVEFLHACALICDDLMTARPSGAGNPPRTSGWPARTGGTLAGATSRVRPGGRARPRSPGFHLGRRRPV